MMSGIIRDVGVRTVSVILKESLVARCILSSITVVVLLFAVSDDAFAQMFGNRTFGQSLSRRSRVGSLEDAGTLTGNERFWRNNRRRTDFVGTDSREQNAFVGAVQANTTGTVRSATAGLRVEMGETSSVNRARGAPSQTGRYDPRLQVAFSVPSQDEPVANSELAHRLDSVETIARTGPIEVLVANRTAILRGEVSSERDRRMAELMILFEPGISAVRNELTVRAMKIPPAPAPNQGERGQTNPQ